LPPDHGAECLEIEVGDPCQRDEGRAERAVRNGRRVADESQLRGFERPEPQADEQGAGDGDWRAEAGRAFDEGPEAEGDEQRLNAPVRRQAGDLPLQHGELARVDR
jgi:hypothetical protein